VDIYDDGMCIHRKPRGSGCQEYPCGDGPTDHPLMSKLYEEALQDAAWREMVQLGQEIGGD
jgi:hypothetical protein